MSPSRSRRALVALAVLVCLALPAAVQARTLPHGAAPSAAISASHSAGLLSGLWGFLVRLWEGSGMTIDPNGGAGAANSGGNVHLGSGSGDPGGG